jgi:thioredoxin 1
MEKRMELIKQTHVVELSAQNASQVIAQLSSTLIVDFYAEWCGPCKSLEPVFEELAAELKDKYVFARINIDNCQAVAQEYRIMSIPTIALFSNGKVLDKITGFRSKQELIAWINATLAMPQDLSKLDQRALNEKLISAVQNMAGINDIQALIHAGADVNCVSSQGVTPLMIVIIMKAPAGIDVIDIIELLLQHGASTEFIIPHTGQKIEASEYIAQYIQGLQRVISNVEKIALLLEK